MPDEDLRIRWDARYREGGADGAAARVLAENVHLLPASGVALDLACGTGGNAMLLAARGLEAHAWDISPVAIERVRARAEREGLAVDAVVRDVEEAPPEAGSFDVIVVSRVLERGVAPRLVAALRPGGLLFYQTFVRDKVADVGPSNPVYLLEDNELLRLFFGLRVRVYRDEGRVGGSTHGFRNEAMLVGEKV